MASASSEGGAFSLGTNRTISPLICNGSVASNRDLAALMGVSDGEATKRRGEVAHLLIEEQQGKQRRIALRG